MSTIIISHIQIVEISWKNQENRGWNQGKSSYSRCGGYSLIKLERLIGIVKMFWAQKRKGSMTKFVTMIKLWGKNEDVRIGYGNIRVILIYGQKIMQEINIIVESLKQYFNNQPLKLGGTQGIFPSFELFFLILRVVKYFSFFGFLEPWRWRGC